MTEDVLAELLAFRDDRDWGQFHTPANLAKSIAIEAGELLEHFQWDDEFDKREVADELADVMSYCLLLADQLKMEPSEIIRAKIARNVERYPVELAHGTSTKHDRLR